ncbi:C40 family peptidase [Georgenia subflava]|uniref:Glycoside hydrolase n=1 Tax=Georgenia subflava TaxID=1622177 RepID=A0A6N7ED38_9MICO|nr:C40 family peptidase [Georgenia subflava]MPV35900.1 glycoside hydrolase [Georgenia subflava]
MTTSTTLGGRHRAARRPNTPLSILLTSSPSARRGLMTVATSGLVLTMAATTATAAPDSSTTALPEVDVTSLTDAARNALVTTPTVTVPADVEWSVDAVASDVEVSAAPEPEPAPVVTEQVDRSQQAASRAGTREAPAQTATAAAPAAVSASTSGSAIVNYARQFQGTPYMWGGTTPAGFDCAGFTWYVFKNFGINLPLSSAGQQSVGTRVSAAEARPGDLVVWPGHVGIYTGNGNYISALNPSMPLSEAPISAHSSSWSFRRV